MKTSTAGSFWRQKTGDPQTPSSAEACTGVTGTALSTALSTAFCVGDPDGEGGEGGEGEEAHLAGLVRAGIQARGYHVVSAGELRGLACGEDPDDAELLRRLHRFASRHGWEAAARRGLGRVLFQPLGQRRVVPGIWRLRGAAQG